MRRSVGRLAVVVLVAASSLLLPGCFSKAGGGSDGGTSFEGVEAGFGSLPIESLAVVVYQLSADVENQSIGGSHCGPFTQTVSCPKGGTVSITGNSANCPAAGGSGVESINFTYTMSGCTDVADGVTVSLTGVAVHSGTLTTTSGALTAQDVGFQATSSVLIAATQGSSSYSESCTFGLTYKLSAGTLTLDGSICGDPFSASFADR